MSTQNKLGKLITRFEIGFDNETKADIDALKAKIDELTRALSVKNDSHGDRLLAAMQAEAANDAPELLDLGQWVFEGQDEKWQSAAVNSDGRAYLHNMPKKKMYFNHDSYGWCAKRFDRHEMKLIEGFFDPSGFATGFIERETVNDVDYLTSSAPKQKGIPTFIAIDEYDSLSECVPHIYDVLDQPNWLSESVPKITQADMQLIFIKNLSETLIQRMHSMNRFSEDDYAIGGDKLMAWDIVFNDLGNEFGIVTGFNKYHQMMVSFFKQCANGQTMTGSLNFHLTTMIGKNLRTITESELPAFRAALEACYA